MELKVKKNDPNAVVPTKSFASSIGYDLYALENVFLPIGSTKLILTGISVDLPYLHVLEIKDRSSMAIKGIRTGAGVIDPTYHGDLSVILHNLNFKDDSTITGQQGYQIKSGDKIAQFIVYKVESVTFIERDVFEFFDRGIKGFGSSGR